MTEQPGRTLSPQRERRRIEQLPVAPPRGAVVLGARDRIAYAALTVLWLVVVLQFWTMWLTPHHRGELWLYVPTSLALAYLSTAMPAFFWFYVGRMRRPPEIAPDPDLRVAMITLCVPSHETLDIIEEQLRALVDVEYPHDSWVLDEGGDPRVRELAREIGVHYFTRRGEPRWNRPGPPFQAKTKAGNVNAWLDHVDELGHDYDCFVQLDIDHRPSPDYLDRTLGHFAHPQVAWVQAPSVYGNLRHWTARGLTEQDLVLQGPLQMGFYGHSGTPFIIGSHTTYRTSAVREIGGFQPTRAEDHLDTVVLAAHGYRGVYVPEVIATGDGPEDFGTYLGQQFAWAYSMVQIFLHHTPRLVRSYTLRQAFQFLVAQSWYTLWSLSLAVLWLLPIVALLSGHAIAEVSLLEFVLYHTAVIATSTAMWWWCRRWFQPVGVGLSWRDLVLELARWPIVLWAVINVLLRVKRPYMITRKGARTGAPPPAAGLYGPYIGLAMLGIGATLVFHFAIGLNASTGYLLLVLLNSALVVALLMATLAAEQRELRRRFGSRAAALRARLPTLAVVAVLWIAGGVATALVWGSLNTAFDHDHEGAREVTAPLPFLR